MKRTEFLRWYLPLLLWATTILILTSIPTLKPQSLGFNAEDKLAHFGVYYSLGLLRVRALGSGYRAENRVLLKSLLLGVSFAALDEAHQILIPGRSGDIFDFLADSLGILCALITFWLVKNCVHNHKCGMIK